MQWTAVDDEKTHQQKWRLRDGGQFQGRTIGYDWYQLLRYDFQPLREWLPVLELRGVHTLPLPRHNGWECPACGVQCNTSDRCEKCRVYWDDRARSECNMCHNLVPEGRMCECNLDTSASYYICLKCETDGVFDPGGDRSTSHPRDSSCPSSRRYP